MSEFILNSGLLRKSLQFNGLFSGLSALICLFFAESIATFLGLGVEKSGEILGQGVSLLIFSIFLFLAASQLTENRRKVLLICGAIAIVLDIIWVIGSANVLINNLLPLSASGKWTVGIIALFVLDFAIFQSLGLKKILAKN